RRLPHVAKSLVAPSAHALQFEAKRAEAPGSRSLGFAGGLSGRSRWMTQERSDAQAGEMRTLDADGDPQEAGGARRRVDHVGTGGSTAGPTFFSRNMHRRCPRR